MSDLAAKFALLSIELMADGEQPQKRFQGLTSEGMLRQYQNILTKRLGSADWGVITFGFSDQAILNLLTEEFEINPDRRRLLFRKTFLDAQSIRLANAGRLSADHDSLTPAGEKLVQELSTWLLEATRSLYRHDLSEVRLSDIQQEYAENFRMYATRSQNMNEWDDAESCLRALFGSVKIMMGFCHASTVDAMFKADAAKILFGENSGYHQAWFRKQIFRHMISHAVDDYIKACLL